MKPLLPDTAVRRRMRVLTLLMMCCIIVIPGAAADGDGNPDTHKAGPRVLPPSNPRAYLLMPPADAPLTSARVRVVWNLSPDRAITGYRVTLSMSGLPQHEVRVDAGTQRWDSPPIQLQHPAPIVQVRALRGDRESPPTQVTVPLVITYPAILPPGERNVHQLPPASIKALLEDPDTGAVWIGTDGGGLARLEPATGNIEWFTRLDGLAGNHVYALAFSKARDGRLWVATEGGLTRFNTRSPTRVTETFDYQLDIYKELLPGQREITSVYEDREGKVWIGTAADGLLEFTPRTHVGRRITTADGLANDTVWSILEDEPGRRLWLGTNEGLSIYNLSGEGTSNTVRLGDAIRSMARGPDGRLWLVTPEKLYSWEPDKVHTYTHHDFGPLEDPQPGAVVASPDGVLWVGTSIGLRCFKIGTRLQDFRRLELPPIRVGEGLDLTTFEISALMRARDGSLWAGLPLGLGLAHYSPVTGEVKHYPSANLPLQQRVNALLKDRQGMLWIGTERGPIRMSPDRRFIPMTSIRASHEGGEQMSPASILSMTLDELGTIWLGLQGNIIRYDPNEKKFKPFFRADSPFGGAGVNAIETSSSAVYVASETAGLKVYGPGTSEEYLEQNLSQTRGNLPTDGVLSLLLDRPTLWIGTKGGLFKAQIRSNPPEPPKLELVSEWPPPELPEGLRLGAINRMLLDGQRSLWVACAQGVWRRDLGSMNGREVWQPMLASSINYPAQSIALDRKRRLWVGTSRGLFRSATPTDGRDGYSDEPTRVTDNTGAIRAILVDEDDVAYIGTDHGLMIVPPFTSLQPAPEPPDRSAAIALVLVLFAGGTLWWYRIFRHPVVVAVRSSPDAVTTFRLPELPAVVTALKRAHRLQAAVLLLGLDSQRWKRVLDASNAWPTGRAPVAPEAAGRIVHALMDVIGAEVLPLSSVRQAEPLPIDDFGFAFTSGDIPAGDGEAEPLPAPEAPFSADQHPEGFDIGAPGAHREQVESTQDPVPFAADEAGGASIDAEAEFDDGQAPHAAAAAQRLTVRTTGGDHSGTHLATRVPETVQHDLGAPLPFVVRLPDLPIRLPQRELPLLVVRSSLPEEYPAAPLLRALEGLSLSPRYVLVLNLSQDPSLPALNATGTRFVAFHEPDVRGLLFSASPRTGFVRHFIRRVKVTEVSPYSSKGEVSNPMMFVGRRIELDRVIGNDRVNYSIVGARQIGKSSLMGAIKRHFRDRTPRDVHAFTLTPQEDARAFYKRFALLLNEERIPRDATEFAEMMEAHYRGQQPPLFLIDEVDGLLARERLLGYPVLTAMRRLQQQDIASFIIAGYWELYRLGNDYHSPLYNMAEVIELGPLKQDEARDLIVSPMERMGLTFDRRTVVQEIVDSTAGHPHLIQFICNQLLERMTTTHPPVFGMADWQHVQDSDELKRYVTRNFKSNAGPLDELIVYATVAALRFTHPQLEQALRSLGLEVPLRAREESLRKLKLVGILREVEGRFEYSLPLFRRMLLKENIAYFAAARARELREGLNP